MTRWEVHLPGGRAGDLRLGPAAAGQCRAATDAGRRGRQQRAEQAAAARTAASRVPGHDQRQDRAPEDEHLDQHGEREHLDRRSRRGEHAPQHARRGGRRHGEDQTRRRRPAERTTPQTASAASAASSARKATVSHIQFQICAMPDSRDRRSLESSVLAESCAVKPQAAMRRPPTKPPI